MRVVNQLLIAVAVAMTLQAQADLLNRAPKDVDDSLRARVNKFFQSYVDGKPRPAMALVAEDTQDLWFDSDKPKYKSFDILSVSYSDEFRKAKVTILAEQLVKQRMGEFLMKVPMTSTWRVEDGQWFYYVDKSVRGTKETPFGLMKAGGGESNGQTGLGRLTDPTKLFSGVWIDKSKLRIAANAELLVTNSLPGSVHLTIEMDKCEGLTAALEKSELAANEKAKLNFTFNGFSNSRGKTVQARVIVKETSQALPVSVTVD